MRSPLDRLLEAAFRRNLRRAGERPTIPDDRVTRDLVYADSGERLDVYRPDPDRAPMLLLLHGGGWRASDKARYDPLGRAFAAHGRLTLVANYRLAPKHRHPAAARDVAAAVAWAMNRGAEHGGDPANLVVLGQSAGAHLGALVASDPTYLAAHGRRPDELAGFVGLSGLYDLTLPLLGLPLERRRALIPAFGSDETGWRDASPVQHVTTAGPPMLLAVAERDPAAIHRQRLAFAARLLAVARPLTLVTLRGRDHHTALAALGTPADPITSLMAHWPSPDAALGRFERQRSEQ